MNSFVKFGKSALLLSLQLILTTSLWAVEIIDSNSVIIEKPAVEIVDSNSVITEKPAVVIDSNSAFSSTPVLSSKMNEAMQKRVSVDFRNTPIDDVIRTLADQAGVDVVKSPSVTGEVTTTLTNVPLGEALDSILAAHGYGYTATENIIHIAPASEINDKSEKLTSKIYRVTYADVTEVEKGLRKFISKSGTISANPGTSNIIVTDTETKIAAIDDFIKEIDRVTPQVLVEIRIYDITSKDRLDLGVNWSAGTNTTLGALPGTGEDGLQGTQGGKTEPFTRGNFNSSVNKSTGSDNAIRFGVLNGSTNIDAIIRAEQENVCATLLANPRILVLDNEHAIFKSVSEIPYQQLRETSAGGSIGTTEFREVGVALEVIPHVVTADKMVRMRVMPKFSIVTGSVIVGGFTVTSPQPVVDSRTADTTLLVRDNQTIVLGGLKKKEVQKQTNKVPWLGDIPGLGWLFKFNGEETVISELVVFITPKIVEEPVMSPEETEMLDATKVCKPTCAAPKLEECAKQNSL